jgi:hypothetical protein
MWSELASNPAPAAAGSLLVIGSSDARSQYQLAGKYVVEAPSALLSSFLAAKPAEKTVPLYLDVSIPEDPYNNDLWSKAPTLGPASQPSVVESKPGQCSGEAGHQRRCRTQAHA